MIRPISPSDTSSVMALAKDSGLFDSAGLEQVQAMLLESFNGSNEQLWIAEEQDGLSGVAYCIPEPMTDGTWNVLMLIVRSDRRGQGTGAALMQYLEKMLAERGERLLIVETSGVDSFERTRQFYRKCGYTEEARIRNFYTAGDDKIIFSKALAV